MQLSNTFIALILCLITFNTAGQVKFLDSALSRVSILNKSPHSKEEIEYQSEINGIKLAKKFTLPEKINARMSEWDKCESLLLALPSSTFKDSAIRDYFMNIITSAIQATNIIILINKDDLLSQTKLITLLKQKGLPIHPDPKAPDKRSIEIIAATFNSKWIRDYGPSIVYNNKGEICLIDAIYYRKESYTKEIDEFDSNSNHYDDIISIYLTSHYNTVKKRNVNLVKPPIQLWGGDYQTDSKGNVFTSTETLVMNGGVPDEVNKIFKDYYGAKTVTYLHPLPGITIKHIDMFFKLVNDSTILLGKYEPTLITDTIASNCNTYKEYLEIEISRILDLDSALIKNNFPYMKIIRMPLPAISIKTKGEDILFKIIDSLNKRYTLLTMQYDSCEAIYDSMAAQLDSNEKNTLLDTLMAEVILDELDDITEKQDKLQAKIDLYQDLFNTLLDDDPNNKRYIYRTFLNSLYINGSGGEIVMIPTYKEDLSLEPVVLEIYHTVYPRAKIVFINSDAIIPQYGAIHCTTLILP